MGRFTKMMHAVHVTKTVDAPQMAEIFRDHILMYHGLPESLVSDRDARFDSDFWQEPQRLLGTKLNMSTAHHPQTDGQTERANRTG